MIIQTKQNKIAHIDEFWFFHLNKIDYNIVLKSFERTSFYHSKNVLELQFLKLDKIIHDSPYNLSNFFFLAIFAVAFSFVSLIFFLEK